MSDWLLAQVTAPSYNGAPSSLYSQYLCPLQTETESESFEAGRIKKKQVSKSCMTLAHRSHRGDGPVETWSMWRTHLFHSKTATSGIRIRKSWRVFSFPHRGA